MKFGGIDVGQSVHFACVIDLAERRLLMAPAELNTHAVVDWMKQKCPDSIAIDSPTGPNTGILRAWAAARSKFGMQTDRRVAEFMLYISGVYGTPSALPSNGTRAWMGAGFGLYRALQQGLGMSVDLGDGGGQLLETHPTYAFKACLGHQSLSEVGLGERFNCDPERILRPKRKTLGSNQRQQLLALALEELEIPVTPEHRRQWQQRIDWVDATICALIAAWRNYFPKQIRAVGDSREGSIWLRFPEQVFLLSNALPVTKINRKSQSAFADPGDIRPNACILRLGVCGPAGMNQEDTINCALLAAQEEGQLWFPIGVARPGQIVERLETDNWWFCAAWAGTIRLRSRVVRVATIPTEFPPSPPPNGCPNVWTKDGSLATSSCWIQLDGDTLEDVAWEVHQFQTWQHGAWRNGFGQGQTALVRGVVPE